MRSKNSLRATLGALTGLLLLGFASCETSEEKETNPAPDFEKSYHLVKDSVTRELDTVWVQEIYYHESRQPEKIVNYGKMAKTPGTLEITYDQNGLRLEEVNRDPQGNALEKVEYSYNNQNLMEERVVLNSKGQVLERNTFTYTDEGQILSTDQYNHRGDLLAHDEFTHNEFGLMVEEKSFHQGTLMEVNKYAYDDQGRMLMETRFEGEDGRQTILDALVYNEKGLLVRESRKYEDGRRDVYEYEYDDKNQKIRENFKGRNYGEGHLKLMTYSEKGLLMETVTKDSDGVSGKVVWEYNEDGRLLQEDTYWEDDILYSRIVYEYGWNDK